MEKKACQRGLVKASRGRQFTCGRRVKEPAHGRAPQPFFERAWKLESVTLARLAALGI
jgi:hypothetical protein